MDAVFDVPNVAAMGGYVFLNDGQADAGASCSVFGLAGASIERFEHPVSINNSHAGAIVQHVQSHTPCRLRQDQADRATVGRKPDGV